MASIVSSVICPVLKLWLRSQADAVENLEIEIAGRSKQILGGNIPKALVSGESLIYQGLHITNVDLRAENINLNIPQILKGEALRLLEPIEVSLDMLLAAHDLQKCLASPLLTEELGYQPQAQTDAEIGEFMAILLKKLGDQFILHDLNVQNGDCRCLGAFMISAT
ncbi:hypothetical protein Pse7367_2615 [Thalassoporum mexicanum PCC 7367]|uniref:LmeA family phospholipid-binding protein n=1 Tax=Thalassoporum mexicanum TaxID=3457544 RepID=UPI00029FA2F4|nr:DUF2993 domain-containing protein [Pseudanabaena sp. PCC 7367]AFY70871.1 hypothetical protein Pse7367_2615 [Pseudanabaena sp. PCC 7367]